MKLHASDIEAGYAGKPVLDGLDLQLADGEIAGIIGPNGSGKSTLLKVLARLLKPDRGVVYLGDRNIRRMGSRQVARRLAVLPQHPTAPTGLTVRDLVGYGLFPHTPWLSRLGRTDGGVIDEALDQCNLRPLADRPLATLSGGERQRAWVAMALAQRPRVLLLDEPVTFLDVSHQLDLLELLVRLNAERGITMVMVMHEINLAARYCHRLLAMRDGRIVRDGTVEQVLQPEVIEQVFGIAAAVAACPVSGRPMCHFYKTNQ